MHSGAGFSMKAKTDFDEYLDRQLADPEFASRFERACAAVGHISAAGQPCLESPSYEGHSLSMLRRVARALNAEIHVRVTPLPEVRRSVVAEPRAKYRVKKGKKT
jgi:hypothetical protein